MKETRYQLVARVSDLDFLKDNIHGKGDLFYQEDNQGNLTRVVYFSNSRIVEYTGKLDEEQARIIRAEGLHMETIEFDELHDSIEVIQAKTN